jgi:hypothetical protein
MYGHILMDKGVVMKTRNWLAYHAFQRSGAGKHKSKKTYSRKDKHKKIYA